MAKEIEINVKATGIGALKAELKDLKGQLADATDPADMERLARAAGDVSDQIKDVNERVAVFAAGSEFEKVSNGLGLVGGQLSSLDFKGAAESAKLLTTSIKGIDPKAFAGEVKGLISTVGSLSKAFIQMGIKLLANPLFLLIAVIGAIVGVIIMLKDKVKIIEQAFDMLMIPINALIEGLKMLGDYLGVTSFAADEAAEKHVKANEKMVASYQDRNEKIVETFDREIRMAKINGEDTDKLELEKQKSIKDSAYQQAKTTKDSIDTIRDQMSRSTREQKKELQTQLDDLRGKYKEQTQIVSNSGFEIQAITAQALADDKAAEEKAAQESAAKRATWLKAKEDAQKLHVDTLRKIKDIELALLDEGVAKDKAVAEEAYKRQTEDLARTSNTVADKAKLQAAYLAQRNAALVKADTDEQTRVDTKNADDKAKQDAIDAALIAKEDAQFLLLQETTMTKDEWEIAQLAASYEAKFALANGNAELEAALQESLNTDLAAINQAHRDAEAAAEKDLNDKKFDAVRNGFATIGNLAVLFAGKSEASQRKAFQVQKAANIAMATMDTYKAATGAYASLAGIPTVGPVLGALAAAAAVTAGLINVKNISSQQFGGGGSTAPAAAPAPISTPTDSRGGGTSSTPVTPSYNLFGKPNTMNDVGSTTSSQGNLNQNIVVTAVVSESDISGVQNKVAKMNNSSEL